MKNYKNGAFYIAVTGGFSALIYWIISEGKFLEGNKEITTTASQNGSWNDFIDSILHNLQDPLAILLAQIVTIIIAARFFGWVFKKIGIHLKLLRFVSHFYLMNLALLKGFIIFKKGIKSSIWEPTKRNQ